jgi:hypothetical protein
METRKQILDPITTLPQGNVDLSVRKQSIFPCVHKWKPGDIKRNTAVRRTEYEFNTVGD